MSSILARLTQMERTLDKSGDCPVCGGHGVGHVSMVLAGGDVPAQGCGLCGQVDTSASRVVVLHPSKPSVPVASTPLGSKVTLAVGFLLCLSLSGCNPSPKPQPIPHNPSPAPAVDTLGKAVAAEPVALRAETKVMRAAVAEAVPVQASPDYARQVAALDRIIGSAGRIDDSASRLEALAVQVDALRAAVQASDKESAALRKAVDDGAKLLAERDKTITDMRAEEQASFARTIAGWSRIAAGFAVLAFIGVIVELWAFKSISGAAIAGIICGSCVAVASLLRWWAVHLELVTIVAGVAVAATVAWLIYTRLDFARLRTAARAMATGIEAQPAEVAASVKASVAAAAGPAADSIKGTILGIKRSAGLGGVGVSPLEAARAAASMGQG